MKSLKIFNRQRPRVALALGSGGARGLAHIGVLKVLEKNHIPIDYIAGASVGALVGALYSIKPEYRLLESLALEHAERRLYSLVDLSIRGGILKGDKLEGYIQQLLGTDSFDALKIPFAAVATDIATAQTVVFNEGSLSRAIRASASIPTMFQTVNYQDRLLADGGLSDPVPADVARQMGGTLVIGVNLDMLYVDQQSSKRPTLSRMPMHSVNILRHHLALRSTASADITISPLVYSGVFALRDFFDMSKIQQFIQEGERATWEAMPMIKSALESHSRYHPIERIRSFLGPSSRQVT